jgi:hypothetical protein
MLGVLDNKQSTSPQHAGRCSWITTNDAFAMTVPQAYPPAPSGACLIPLTQGRYALVDTEDYERVMQHCWYFDGWYAVRNGRRKGGVHQQPKHRLHHLILPPSAGLEVDHVNGDRLDCRRANLRLATHEENMRNTDRRSSNVSGYKGVSWHRQKRRWRARITVGGKERTIGYYQSVTDAALAYNAAAVRLHGDFARLNEVPHGH